MAKISNTVLMVEPQSFGFNTQTAGSNAFQQQESVLPSKNIQHQALGEFNAFVSLLKKYGIKVLRFRDDKPGLTPDSIFPNNWFCTDQQGLLLTFPMAAENRRAERREDILDFLQKNYRYRFESLADYEKAGQFLEGTGSLVIDHASRTAFAALSPRTDKQVLEAYSAKSGNEIVAFEALGPAGEAIYHTNVMLCIADDFALIGLETIAAKDRDRIKTKLESLGKELIFLSNEQVYLYFAGNALQLQNESGEKFLVMSQKARNSLTEGQLEQIHRHKNQILAPQLDTIETIGGGSARCMLAEIF